jgi:hypothetical protein
MLLLFIFLTLCFGSILCYFSHENINNDGGWMNFLDKIKNSFLCFMAKFWLTAVLGLGCFASLMGIFCNLFAE